MAVAVPDRELFAIKTWDALKERCEYAVIKYHVDQEIKSHDNVINVSKAMQDLTLVGDLLKLAYAGSKGFGCNVVVVEVMSKYQDLIKKTVVTSSTFVNVIMRALSFHKMALILAAKDCSKAMTALGKCGEIATKMADESKKMVDLADGLAKLSEKGWLKATEDLNLSIEERKKIEDQAKRYKEKQANQQTRFRDLVQDIEEIKEEESKARKEAEGAELLGAVLTTSITQIFTWGMNTKFEARAEKARKREEEAHKKRMEMQKEEREANAGLQEVIMQLKNCAFSKDELKTSVHALDITTQTMGQIKTVFANSVKFWEMMKTRCDGLTNKQEDAQMYLEAELVDEFLDSIKASGYSWLALGRINVLAAESINQVDSKVDGILCNLPSMSEAPNLIDQLSTKLLSSIAQENKQIEESLSEKQ